MVIFLYFFYKTKPTKCSVTSYPCGAKRLSSQSERVFIIKFYSSVLQKFSCSSSGTLNIRKRLRFMKLPSNDGLVHSTT